jgi:hypothetical protein
MDELFEFLRGIADNPARAIGPIWTLLWLWSVVRGWINRMREAREQQAAEAREQPAPPKPPPPPTPVVEKRTPEVSKPVASPWQGLLERAEALRLRLLHEPTLRWLEPILVSEVLEPLRAVVARSRTTDATPELARRATAARVTLQALEQVARERETDPDSAWLFELDRIAATAQRPLSAYARAKELPFIGHTPLAARFDTRPEHYAHGLTRALLFLPARGTGASLEHYALAMQALGRRWFEAFPQLGDELRDERDLQRSVALVDARYGFDERAAYAAFGPWLPALFADVMLSLRFGNAYVTALRHQVVARGPLALRAFAQGETLGREPPMLLRMHAALHVLEALGRRDEAKLHRAALAKALPDTSQILFPVAGGNHVALPSAFMISLTEELASALLETRLPALGGVPLLEWPGLPQTLEDAREQLSLSRELLQGVPRNADPAQLLSAAWLAAEQHDPALVLAGLRRALSPRAIAARQAPAVPSARAPRTLHAAFRDPRTLRSAILLGAALSPPRTIRIEAQAPGSSASLRK